MNARAVDLVAACFDLGAPTGSPPAFVARGAMGAIWRVTTERGRWAVKALFDWEPPQPRPADVDVQLAALDAGLRLPRPLLTAAGDAVVEIDGHRFRAYEWVDLGPALHPPAPPATAQAVGAILGTIHGLPIPAVTLADEWYCTPPEASRWGRLVELATAAGKPWAGDLEARVPRLLELAAFAAGASPHPPPITCHRDFEPGNVLPDAAGVLVTLDWENTGPLAADREIAYALLAWTVCGARPDAASVHAFLDGYAAKSSSPPTVTADSFDVAVTTTLNFLSVMVDQASEDDAQHAEFADANVRALLAGCEDLARSIDQMEPLLAR